MAKAIREVYAETLSALADTMDNIVVLDADVANSSKSCIFKEAHPDRFYDMGIAEANMAATAAGLSTTGFIPFINTFGVFISSATLVALRGQICYGNLNVKLAGAYEGLSNSFDGATHHGTEDIAIMRSLPNMHILNPCDTAETKWATEYMAKAQGPYYMRVHRNPLPDIYPEDHEFTFGKAETLREGTDATIIATGYMVHNALAAADALAEKGISVAVLDMHTLKPVDEEAVIKAAKAGPVVTAEEHSIIGGLGGAVAEIMAENCCGNGLARIGIRDVFTETGPYDALLKKYGLDADAICAAVEGVVKK